MIHTSKILAGLAVAAGLTAGSLQAQCPGGNCSSSLFAYRAFYGRYSCSGYNYTYQPMSQSAPPQKGAVTDSGPEEKTVTAVTLKPFASRVIELVNQARAQAGLPALIADETLCGGCDSHSTFMRSYGFGHGNSGGLECIAYGVSSPEAVVRLWLNSSGHRAILLGRGSKIGAGYSGTFWTLRVR